ncbi:hypothetical protein Tco_1315749 [Tanacetum coccineum]
MIQMADDTADINPFMTKSQWLEVQLTLNANIIAIGQQHTEQPEIINKGRVDQYPETCQVKSLMLDSSSDNQTTEYSKQSLDVATLRKENETLKQHYKDLYDSIKITRSKTTEQTTSLLANNAEIKSLRFQKRFLQYAALKNDLRKIKEKWIPTGKLFDSCTSKVDCEPPHGSNADIPNIHECKQTLDVSAGTSNLSAGTSFNPKKEELRVWLLKRLVSHKQASRNSNLKQDNVVCSQTFSQSILNVQTTLNKTVQASAHNVNRSSSSS